MPPALAIVATASFTSAETHLPVLASIFCDGVRGALTNLAAVEIDAGHARMRGKRDESGVMRRKFAATQTVFFLGEHHDRAALGSFVGERSQLRSVREFSLS